MPTIQPPPETITPQLLKSLANGEPGALDKLAIACHDRHRLTLDYDPDLGYPQDDPWMPDLTWVCHIDDVEGHGSNAYEACRRAVEAFLACAQPPDQPEAAMPPPDDAKRTIHEPVLGNAAAHGLDPGAESMSALQPGDCVAVLTPEHPPHQIVVRVLEFAVERIIGGPLVPSTLVGEIEPDQSFGPLLRPRDPAFAPGSRIRFHRANISRLY